MHGTLFLVSVPIGNLEDFTLRGIRVLKEVDLVVCEEYREGKRLLRALDVEKPTVLLNEHEEEEGTEEAMAALRQGKLVALISDAGTPVFSDPGRLLVQRASEAGMRIVPVPGASSLMPALVVSGFSIKEFTFRGFLSVKRDERIRQLRALKAEPRTIVLMDTPYRMEALIKDVADVFGNSRQLCVAMNLTQENERILRGSAVDVLKELKEGEKKAEFVLVISGH